jgi:hypothetical protein
MGCDDAERFLEKKKRTHTVQTVVDQQNEVNFFLIAQQPLVSLGPLIVKAFRSHSLDTPHSVGLIWTSGRPLA